MISMNYVLAGKSTFTIANPSNVHYTYKVILSKFGKYFVYLLTPKKYVYIGMFVDELVLTKASTMKQTSLPVRVFDFVIRIIKGQPLPKGYFLSHMGHCGHCGRKLTTPDSIKAGIGPTCLSKSRNTII